jgi:hypothetical protein
MIERASLAGKVCLSFVETFIGALPCLIQQRSISVAFGAGRALSQIYDCLA